MTHTLTIAIAVALLLPACLKSPEEHEAERLSERCHEQHRLEACEALCEASEESDCYGVVAIYFKGEAARALLSRGCDAGSADLCATLALQTDAPSRRLELYERACDAGSVDGCQGVSQLLSGLEPVVRATEDAPRDWRRAIQASLRACELGGDATCLQARFIEALAVRAALCEATPSEAPCPGLDPHALAERGGFASLTARLEQACEAGNQARCAAAERLARAGSDTGARLRALTDSGSP